MKNTLSGLAAGAALSGLLLSPAMARPVTNADLSGKTICWIGGMRGPSRSTYLPGGKRTDDKGFGGTWQITQAGVLFINDYFNFVADIQILPDGSFTSETDAAGRVYLETGHYCK